MNLVFPLTYTIWLLSEIILNRLLRSKSTDMQQTDKNSLSLIWLTVVPANIIATYISLNFYLPITANPLIEWIGIAIVLIGIFLRLAAVVSLGRFFTVDVTIRENHQLKTDGFYKYVRHPSYSASLLSFVGYGISLNNWLSLILIFSAVFTVFMIRIRIEEKVLTGRFGAEYLAYRKTTKTLIPFIW